MSMSQKQMCSKCGSDDLQKVSLVYEAGTTIVNAQTAGAFAGAGYADKPGVFGGFTDSATKGEQQTLLAKRLAPPPKPKEIDYLSVSIVIALVAILVALANLWVGLLLFIGTAVWSFRAPRVYKERMGVWETQMASWNRQWFCRRCGQVSEFST